MNPIYKPKGKAKEYGDLAINIYTGCPHRCYYCFAPTVLRRDRERFHSVVKPRNDIVSAVAKQLEREQVTGKLIHLCFTCDPYPTGCDSTATREIIKLLKDSGNHVQILTKGDGTRDFDLLDGEDWYGITYSCGDKAAMHAEPGAISPIDRLMCLGAARERGIKTWVSFEPVLNASDVGYQIAWRHGLFDKIMIGKLNYHKSDIDWAAFGVVAEGFCKASGVEYHIKESLRAEMDKARREPIDVPRMLAPKELCAAIGFPPEDEDVGGWRR